MAESHWDQMLDVYHNPHEVAASSKAKSVGRMLAGGNVSSMMSIGCGNGRLDEFILKQNNISLSRFLGIEPDGELRKKLETRLKSWNVPYHVESEYFSGTYSYDGEGFDLIIMSSVLYYMKDVGLAIAKARSFLNPNGKLVIFHQTLPGGCEIFRYLLKAQPVRKQNTFRYDMCHLDVLKALNERGIPFKCNVTDDINYGVDVDDFVRKYKEGYRKNTFIDFMLQTPLTELGKEIQDGVYEIVKQSSALNDKKRYILFDDYAAISITS